jgi:Domain of unknown function (DUF3859)
MKCKHRTGDARKRLFSCSFLLLITATLVNGQSPSAAASPPAVRVDRVEFVEKGLYRVEVKKEIEDPNMLSGRRLVSSKAEQIKDTDKIPAASGTQFGFRYVVIGEPNGAKVPTRVVVHYPEGGRQNPNNGKIAFKDEFPQTLTIGGPPQFFFMNIKWGLVPGVWTMEVWCQDRKLAEQKFTLVQP